MELYCRTHEMLHVIDKISTVNNNIDIDIYTDSVNTKIAIVTGGNTYKYEYIKLITCIKNCTILY